MQLTITVYVFGYGLSHLIYGPFADWLGRRPILIFGLIVFLFGTVICILANHPYVMIAGRFIQGIGVGSAAVIGRAIARDSFSHIKLIKVMSYIGMAIALSPGIAPTIGGFLHDTVGWRGSFIALFIYVFTLLLIFIRFLPETLKVPGSGKHFIRRAFSNYYYIFTHPTFVINSCIVILALGGYLAFLTVGPFLIQDLLAYSASAYGALLLFIAAGYFFGFLTSHRIISNFGMRKMIFLGSICLTVGALSMFIFALFNIVTAPTVIIPMILFTYGAGLVNSPALTAMLVPFAKIAGTAGAAMGAALMFGMSIYTFLSSIIPETSILPFTLFFFINSLLILLALRYAHAKKVIRF